MKCLLLTASIGLVCLSFAGTGIGQPVETQVLPWQLLLSRRVQEYGHRNWIVIADSAYPAQTRAGIETMVTSSDQLPVVRSVLDQLARAKHVRPVVYLDAELPHVSDKDAPGINKYRQDLQALLGEKKGSDPLNSRGQTPFFPREPHYVPHEKIIDRLDKTAEKFKVLILKTNLTLPYTSVFLELDCGYWSGDAEQRLRKAIGTESK